MYQADMVRRRLLAEATAQAIGAGTDVECGSVYRSLPEAVKTGMISEEKVNESLKRLLEARFRLGDFDQDEQVAWTQIPSSVIASEAHKDLAEKMAEEGIDFFRTGTISCR